jgi:ubiquinone/menaquinone biosynthesis C-methylase UbiE
MTNDRNAKRKNADEYFENVRYATPNTRATRRYAEAKIKHIEDFVKFGKDTTVLDLGCGNGVFTARLAERAGWVVAADASEAMLLHNKDGVKTKCDAAHLPFRDNSFDIVFEANLLHHVTDREAVVKEMLRVSRSKLVFIEPNVMNPAMYLFGLISWVERGSLVFTPRYVDMLLKKSGAVRDAVFCTGMITQNKTYDFLVPILGVFDFKFPLGAYIVAVGSKNGQ